MLIAIYLFVPLLHVIFLGLVVGIPGFFMGLHLVVEGVIVVSIAVFSLSVVLSFLFKDKLIFDWNGRGGWMPGPSVEFDGGSFWILGVVCVIGIVLGYGWAEGVVPMFFSSVGEMLRINFSVTVNFWHSLWRK
ncbi:MAG: hypothetical protein HGB03_03460 [Candidatus Yonathbacteria bacterium]|nr:hypothetical protein [Candidatus Yonathbacteria bacterium]NTW47704.1 hypothetical protein [Candidatus Yonathbacteria bacterium]